MDKQTTSDHGSITDTTPMSDFELLNLVPVATYGCDRTGHIQFCHRAAIKPD